MRIFSCALICAGLITAAQTGAGQSLTDEEMLQRFKAQKDIFESADELGPPRGLSIVSLGDGDDQQIEGNIEVTVAADPASPADTLTPLDPNAPLLPTNAAARFEDDLAVDIRIEFAFDSAAISPSQKPALDQVCRVMSQANEINLFRIIGHTDASGSDEYNKRLSELRAQEVGRYLVNCGVAESRLNIVGYGEQFLASPDAPDDAVNRRVEFQALG